MSFAPIFVDTWGWLALGHREDAHHVEVKKLYQDLRSQRVVIYTSDYVLNETITLVFRRELFAEAVRFIEGLMAAASLSHVIVERVTSERFATAWRLRKQFQDKPRISFTDLTSMSIMQERGISEVLTEDEHFIEVGMGFFKRP